MLDALPEEGRTDRPAFLLKLSRSGALTEEDERVLLGLTGNIRHYRARQSIFIEGDVPRHLLLVKSGWAYRQKYLENGKRQIISVLLPGDFTGPFGALPPALSHSIRAATSLAACLIDVDQLRLAAEESPTLGGALWADLLMDSTSAYERTVTLGSLDALARVGHLFCELHSRLSDIGLVDAGEFEMPMTQADMADLLGLSAVHVNRCMQQLRATGMLSVSGGRAKVHDFQALASASMFEAAAYYLQPRLQMASAASAGSRSSGAIALQLIWIKAARQPSPMPRPVPTSQRGPHCAILAGSSHWRRERYSR